MFCCENRPHTSTRRHGQPVEQPRRLISELASLFLQSLLLRPPITQKVFVPLRQVVPLTPTVDQGLIAVARIAAQHVVCHESCGSSAHDPEPRLALRWQTLQNRQAGVGA
jgi:hypothetical protein